MLKLPLRSVICGMCAALTFVIRVALATSWWMNPRLPPTGVVGCHRSTLSMKSRAFATPPPGLAESTSKWLSGGDPVDAAGVNP